MPVIHPFRATHYNTAKIGDLSQVVTQPYDKIDAKLQETYYQRHPANIARIIKGKEFPTDAPQDNVYSRAADTFRTLLAGETMVRRKTPALYPYHQTYTWIDGTKKTRKGFVAMVQVEDFSSGKIRPHERTLAGPKADRLNLLRATRAHFGQIFMIYDDPGRSVDAAFASFVSGKPILEAKDDDAHLHQVWEVTDEAAVKKVAAAVRDADTFIADGHHRYETALNFRNEMRAAGAKCLPGAGAETFDNVMVTLINLADEGLSLFPTHRVVHSVAGFDAARLTAGLKKHFAIEPVADLDTLRKKMEREAASHVFGLALSGDKPLHALTLLPSVDLDAAIRAEHCPAWKRLDVAILHELILEPLLAIDAASMEKEKNLHYIRHAADAVKMAREGSGGTQAAFLVNPTRVAEVQAVAGTGDRMPQKSTDFYPKLLTGLLACRLEIA